MTNYESIMAILDSNHYAVVKDNAGDYCIFTKDFEIVRRSCRYNDLEIAKQNVSKLFTNKEEINSFNIVEFYELQREQPNIKVGDMVVVMENTRAIDEFNSWNEKAKEMVNSGEYEVGDVVNDAYGLSYLIYTKDKTRWCSFPAHCVCKVYKEEKQQATQEEIDKAIATLTKAGKIVDGKVLI